MSLDETESSKRGPVDRGRRRFLAALASATVGTAAGCSSLTDHEFEADPVGLPEADRTDLLLAQTASDSSTVTREIDAVDGEVTITSHSVAYSRGKAFDFRSSRSADVPDGTEFTLMETFLEESNDAAGPGAAVVATGSSLGIGELALPLFDEDPVVPGDHWSIVVPAGARNDGRVTPDEVMALVPSTGIPGTDWVPGDSWVPGSRWVPGDSWVPGSTWVPGDSWYPGSTWVPGDSWVPDDPQALGVLFATKGRSPEEVFGIPAEEMPGKRIENGDSFTGNNPFLVAVPASDLDGVGPLERETVLNAGTPASAAGATYGLGVLSTPAATVAGQSANPVTGMSSEELLASDHARGLLRQAGVTDANEVEWLAGPTPVADAGGPEGYFDGSDSPDGTTILDEESALESFLGVVSGGDGPWGVGIHLARVEHGSDGGTDVVVAASVHRWPVATPESVQSRDGERFTGILGSILAEARVLTDAAGRQFDTDVDMG